MSPRFPEFPIDETTLVFAFRYALGRRSMAPFHVAAQLKKHWARLADWTQRQIHQEIRREADLYPVEFTKSMHVWREVLALPLKSHAPTNDVCPGCGRRDVMCLCSHDDDDLSGGCG